MATQALTPVIYVDEVGEANINAARATITLYSEGAPIRISLSGEGLMVLSRRARDAADLVWEHIQASNIVPLKKRRA